MKNKLNPNEIIFCLNSDDNVSEKNIDLLDVQEFKTPYDKIKRILKIKKSEYNIYLIDSFLKEKVNTLISIIEKEYESLEAPNDICYASINDKEKPFPIFVSNGRGIQLKEDIKVLKEKYKTTILEFTSDSYTKEKDDILNNLKESRDNHLNELITLATNEGFEMKATNDGFVFIPLKDGKEMSENDYDNLDEEVKEKLIDKAEKLKEESSEILLALKDVEVTSLKKLKNILSEYIEEKLKDFKDDILLEYIVDDDVYNYLDTFYKKIEEELIEIYNVDIEEEEKELDKIIEKYSIEVIVDNSEYNHPRVIFEDDPNIGKLLGTVEYENQNGNYTTDLSLISAGSLLEANGGCIILRLKDLIANNSYQYLKKALLSKKLNFDSNRNYLEVLSINGLKLEPININVKVILIGDYESYNILYNNDEDFKNLFPVKVQIPIEVKLNDKVKEIKNLIKNIREKNCDLEITEEGINSIFKHFVRIASSRENINIDYKEIEKIILLSEQIAYSEGKEIIDKDIINKVIYEDDMIEEEYINMYKEDKVFVNLKGKRVGDINGLAVLDTGTHTFGKAMRITCNVFKGDGTVHDLHKEAKLSGKIHEKSISILKSILLSKWKKTENLPINLYLSFEQSYGLIEGDSASVAEMICMLSAITERGIRQNIAVTGSLNQFGEVQPIGGVNEKIEGFFKICKELNLMKGSGVLIPRTNINELVLNDEVEEEILKGNFSIYYMDKLDEAIEILILDENESVADFNRYLVEKIEEYKK
ncbi:AAA family ATPase [Clostridium thermobutyricum]|uniref:endopeptidase La n=1 Tax=Clostridium thermobutyricum DSM 4928 TaxID=1121339 RepID=A0A1V4SND6_9CLOT|nr:AAA family ATPase [Clostridium thermobutyricum]OPX45313.1 Lon protease [Clostridium thermobutyricum DSM 4928]